MSLFGNAEKTQQSHGLGPAATDGEASNPGPRLRRRGPRSMESRMRRLAHYNSRGNVQNVQGFELPSVVSEEHVAIMHVNVQGWVSHEALLAATVRMTTPKPLFVVMRFS